jgi:methionyl-tRNA synthetase
MSERYRQNRLVPAAGGNRLIDLIGRARAEYGAAMDRLALDEACRAAFGLVDATNEYIAASEPWALAKQDRARELDEVLWTSAEALRVAAVLLSPVMPGSAAEILDRLDAPVRASGDLRLERDAAFTTSGERQVARRPALWPRLEAAPLPPVIVSKETTVTEGPKDMPGGASAEIGVPVVPVAPVVPAMLSFDDFMKIDLRVARVLTAERVANSRKLIKLEVDLGAERRTIVAGIAEAYEAEALVGRTIAMVANLKPAKLMGIESNGMVLAASPEGGTPLLLGFDDPPPPGTRIR